MTVNDDGKLACLQCGGRFAPHLMHRVVVNGRASPQPHISPPPVQRRYHCPECWTRRFSESSGPGIEAEFEVGVVPD
jgi:hypothetical protein